MRIKASMLKCSMGASNMFKEIVVIPCVDNSTSLIILTCNQKNRAGSGNLHEDVSMSLRAMNNPDELNELWIPQFKSF